MPTQEQGSIEKQQGTILPDDNWHYVGATGQPAFTNSWTNFDAAGTGYQSARFIKDAAGVVHIEGLVKSGTIGQAVFTLPEKYRPKEALLFVVVSNAAIGRMDVNATGTVVATAGSNVNFTINCNFYVG